jgi:hypothetical protein
MTQTDMITAADTQAWPIVDMITAADTRAWPIVDITAADTHPWPIVREGPSALAQSVQQKYTEHGNTQLHMSKLQR